MTVKFFRKSHERFSRNAVLYLIALGFYAIAAGAFGMLQGIYIKELKLGEDFLGLLMGSKTIAIAAAAFPCALLVNRIGKKKALFISMMAVPFAILFQGFFKSMWIIYFFGIIEGIFSSLLGVTGSPFLMDNSHGEQRIKLFSFAFAATTFSTMIGYYLSGNIVQAFKGSLDVVSSYRYTIILSGIFGLISVIFIMLMNKNSEAESKSESVSVRQAVAVLKEK
jgi:MFS family permease